MTAATTTSTTTATTTATTNPSTTTATSATWLVSRSRLLTPSRARLWFD